MKIISNIPISGISEAVKISSTGTRETFHKLFTKLLKLIRKLLNFVAYQFLIVA